MKNEKGFISDVFIVVILIIIVFILTVGLIYSLIQEDKEWEKYRIEHNCQEKGYISGTTQTTVAPIIGGNGGVVVGVSSSPRKTRFVCDNGEEIFR